MDNEQRDWLTSILIARWHGLDYFGPDDEWTVCDVRHGSEPNVILIELDTGEDYTLTLERVNSADE